MKIAVPTFNHYNTEQEKASQHFPDAHFVLLDRLVGYGSKSILTDNENTIAEARICRILGLTVWLHYADIVCFYCCEPVRLVLLEDIPYGSEEGMA